MLGCRQTPTTVSGAVTLNGKPLLIQPAQSGKVIFQPVGGHGAIATGRLDSSGHFTLGTGSSFEVARGDYQVAISVSEPLPAKENAESSAKLVTPVKFSSATDSGLRATVTPGENVFEFDLAGEDTGQVGAEASSSAPVTGKDAAQGAR
jgi:hypothetical protein